MRVSAGNQTETSAVRGQQNARMNWRLAPFKSKAIAHVAEQRLVAPEALNVAPALVGLPLARPLRRGLAMSLDLLLVSLLSGVSGLWLWLGLGAVLLQLRSKLGASASGMISKRRWLGWGLAGLLGLLAINEAVDQWSARADPESTVAQAKAAAQELAREAAAEAKEAAAEANADATTAQADADAARKVAAVAQAAASAAEALGVKMQGGVTVRTSAQVAAEAASAAAAPMALSASAAAAAAAEVQVAKARVAELESQLAEAKKPKPFKWREEMKRVFAGIGLQFGWGIVYFSLLPAWWGGQTVGKKLFGLRVVEITGKPMTVMRCLKRYGGYAAGMATGGLGFTQMLWDPNRQGIQDKAAHTVVLDVRPGQVAATAQPLPVETPAPLPPPTA
jgi:RDD family